MPSITLFTKNESKKMDDKERIEAVLTYSGLNNGAFCQKIGMNAANLSHILSERTRPSLPVFKSIAEAFPELNPGWLFMGVGEMINADSSSSSDAVPSAPSAPAETADPSPLYNSTSEMGMFSALNQQFPPQSSQPVHPAAPAINVTDIVTGVVDGLKKPQRKVIEVRIFFDDGTYESFSNR